MDDFYKNLKLCNVGIDIKNDLNSDLVTNVELEEVFGKKRQNGYNGQKLKLNDKLTTTNCISLLKLYEVVCRDLSIGVTTKAKACKGVS